MNIVIISLRFFPDVGGIETVSEILANEFAKIGHIVSVLTTSLSKDNDSGLPYNVYRNPSFRSKMSLFKNADVILEMNPCFRLSWPSFLTRKSHVIALHTWVRGVNGHIRLIDRCKKFLIKHLSSQVIVCSKAMANDGFENAVVIENPYNSSLFKMICPIEQRNKDFIYVGRLVSDKGVALAIKAFSQIKYQFTESTFTIVGNGPELKALKTLVSDLQLSKSISFLGALRGNKLVEVLNQCHIILIPSVWREPFGVVALEGLACGCIPIVSDGGGLKEAVGSAGLIFKRNNVIDLSEKMKNLLSDSSLRQNLLTNRLKVLSSHHANVIAKEYLRILEKSLN